MNTVQSSVGSIGFKHVTGYEALTIEKALIKLINELQLPIEYGYLAQFWHENTQFRLEQYFGDWPKDVQNAFNKYYKIDPTTNTYGMRDYHRESTLFKSLLKGRKHPLEPYFVDDFFDSHSKISKELLICLADEKINQFGPVSFVPFVGIEGHYFFAMLKFSKNEHENRINSKSKIDLLASIIGFATFSISIKPPVLLGTPEFKLIEWINERLRDMIEGMHDTVAHTMRVLWIIRRLVIQMSKDGNLVLNHTNLLKLTAAALVHDFGKEYSLKGLNNLEHISDKMLQCAEEIGKGKSVNKNKDELKKLVQIKTDAQNKYDQHPMYSTRDVYNGMMNIEDLNSLADNPQWKTWLLPVICHHFYNKGAINTKEASNYLDSVGYKMPTVAEVYEKLNDEDKLLTHILALADKIEDDAGFKLHRQTRKGPRNAIEDIKNSAEDKRIFGLELIESLDKCSGAIASIYYRGLDL